MYNTKNIKQRIPQISNQCTKPMHNAVQGPAINLNVTKQKNGWWNSV
jgi:hypothetical protein